MYNNRSALRLLATSIQLVPHAAQVFQEEATFFNYEGRQILTTAIPEPLARDEVATLFEIAVIHGNVPIYQALREPTARVENARDNVGRVYASILEYATRLQPHLVNRIVQDVARTNQNQRFTRPDLVHYMLRNQMFEFAANFHRQPFLRGREDVLEPVSRYLDSLVRTGQFERINDFFESGIGHFESPRTNRRRLLDQHLINTILMRALEAIPGSRPNVEQVSLSLVEGLLSSLTDVQRGQVVRLATRSGQGVVVERLGRGRPAQKGKRIRGG